MAGDRVNRVQCFVAQFLSPSTIWHLHFKCCLMMHSSGDARLDPWLPCRKKDLSEVILKVLSKLLAKSCCPSPAPHSYINAILLPKLRLVSPPKALRSAHDPVAVCRSLPRPQAKPVLSSARPFSLVNILNIVPDNTRSAVSAESSFSLAFHALSHSENLSWVNLTWSLATCHLPSVDWKQDKNKTKIKSKTNRWMSFFTVQPVAVAL